MSFSIDGNYYCSLWKYDIVVKPSHLVDHMNPKHEETYYNVLYYSHVPNKAGCYTVPVE